MTARPPDISVVVVSFNAWHLLDKCLASVRSSTVPVGEIIVVDNASSDETRTMLAKKHPDIRLILNDENLGHPKAVNQGFRAASGRYVLLLDSDTELVADSLEILSEYVERHEEVSMIVPLTLNSDGSIQMTARNFPSVINGLFGRRALLTRLFPNNRFSRRYLLSDGYEGKEPFRVEQISAACMLFRRELLGEVGYFDEKYRGYWVDTDWCQRMKKRGKVLYCVPGAVIYHHEQNKGSQKKHPSRIVSFHLGVLRYYRLHRTLGWLDPRFWAAAGILFSRTLLLLLANTVKSSDGPKKDPFYRDS